MIIIINHKCTCEGDFSLIKRCNYNTVIRQIMYNYCIKIHNIHLFAGLCMHLMREGQLDADDELVFLLYRYKYTLVCKYSAFDRFIPYVYAFCISMKYYFDDSYGTLYKG